MKPHLVFCHGINTNSAERDALQGKMETSLMNFGIASAFSGVSVAKWRSTGKFTLDLIKLPFELDDAISDVMTGLMEPAAPLLVVGHSMGSILAACALNRLLSMGKARSGAFLTLGSPFGDGFARPYFHWVPWFIWAKPPLQTMGVAEWHDIWNPQDPICGGPAYRSFLAAKSHKLDVPGRPGITNPMAEHSAYFGEGLTYSLALGLAEKIAAQ